MDEGWLRTADIRDVIDSVRDPERQRRLRLFSCGVCRHYEGLIRHERIREALDRAERFADGELSDATIERWFRKVRRVAEEPASRGTAEEGVNQAVEWACLPSRYRGYADSWSKLQWQFRHGLKDDAAALEVERVARRLLEDLFGPRPASIDPAWLTPAVVSLAEEVYVDRAFDRLPILSDALEEAGCDDAALLGHLREPGPHARGCWAVDLLLGKA